jgi:triosephosphate isomerase
LNKEELNNKFIILLNFKTYKESLGEKGKILMKAIADNKELADKKNVIVFACPQFVDLREFSKIDENILAQGASNFEAGAHTGSNTIDALKDAGVKGILINHFENQIPLEKIKHLIQGCKDATLLSIVCADTIEKAEQIAEFKPDYLSIELPELIGTGISLTKVNPEIVTNTLEKIKEVPVLCGAGIADAEDVKKAKELGVQGVLVASRFVKSTDPNKWVKEVLDVI